MLKKIWTVPNLSQEIADFPFKIYLTAKLFLMKSLTIVSHLMV